MDSAQSALDSLRTVEFRETLRGYHRDDVDEYLEKAAVEAEGLQEQLRQSSERLRQAAERISHLEAGLDQRPQPEPSADPAIGDETLQRTLVLAQKFVDETKADAEQRASRLLADTEARVRQMTEEAQAQATRIASESEQRLRNEIGRLEEVKATLSQQVETMTRHLESERHRLRSALGDILRWVDQNVQPGSGAEALRPGGPEASAGPTPAGAPAPAAAPGAPAQASPATAVVVSGENRPVGATGGGTPSPSSATGPTGEITQMRPTGVVNRRPDPAPNGNAPLSN